MAFKLISSAFRDGGYIPPWYSRSGGDSSPPLGWTDPPGDARSLALIVMCRDEDTGKDYCHWVLYNIPPEGDTIYGKQPHSDAFDDGTQQGVNSFGEVGWDGPDDDLPDQTLVFRLYALDRRLDLPGGASHRDVLAAMEGHVLQTAELVGRYSPG